MARCNCKERLFRIYLRLHDDEGRRYLLKIGVACEAGHHALDPGLGHPCKCGYMMRKITGEASDGRVGPGLSTWFCGQCDTGREGKRHRILRRMKNLQRPWGWLNPDGRATRD